MGSDTKKGNGAGPPADEARDLECVWRAWTLATRLLADARAAEAVTLRAIERVTRTDASLWDGPELWTCVRGATIAEALTSLRDRGVLAAGPRTSDTPHQGAAPGCAFRVPRDGAELNELVTCLPDAERVVFALAALERLPGLAVAESLGIGEDEVPLLLRSAWAELRGLCLDRQGGTP